VQPFWSNWKDHYFYAVAEPYRPGSPHSLLPNPCDFGQCLTVDGEGPFAAIVIFAGARRTGQNRVTNADYTSPDKGNPGNHLEGQNLTALAASGPGDPGWGAFSRTAGNDIVLPICADADFNIYPNCAFGTTPPQSQCASDGLLLLGYRDSADPSKNNCKNTSGKGKHAELAIQECRDIRDRIKSNCSKQCGDASDGFLKKPCIDNLNDNQCAPFMSSLANCDAS
jgi:hypothetical protein